MNKKPALIIFGGSGEIGEFLVSSLCVRYQIISVHKNKKPTTKGVVDVRVDITNVHKISKICSQIFNKYDVIGAINCIGLNNAHDLSEIDEEKWDKVIDVNLKSLFFICKELGELASDGFSIINFSSTAGIRPQLLSPHYIAAKAGVNALTKYFAGVFAPKIRVNAVAPGYVLTDSHKPENYLQYDSVVDKILLGRMANFDEILQTVEFLLGNEYITGQVIAIDGGITV
jgi:NAD(P)-dependent dehydrogenase (short-subunit alcohol dehydrogenase family)